MQNFIEHLKRVSENNEGSFNKKIAFLKNDIEEYDKRETMFAQQIDALNEEMRGLRAEGNMDKGQSLIQVS